MTSLYRLVTFVEKLLTPQEAAEILGVTTSALAQLRFKGTGPVYQKLSPKTIRYTRTAVEEFVAASTRTGTAEVARA
jgi:hypothetical protein